MERSRSSDSAADFELLRQLAVLQAALRLELGDLRLHLGERLLDGSERLEHAALGLLARLAGLLLGAVLLDELAVLLLRRRGSARAAPRRWPAWRRAPRGAATSPPPRRRAPRRAAPGAAPRRARGLRRRAPVGVRPATTRRRSRGRRGAAPTRRPMRSARRSMPPVSQRPPTSAGQRRSGRVAHHGVASVRLASDGRRRAASTAAPSGRASPRCSRVATGPIAPNRTRVMCARPLEVVGLVPLRRVHDDRRAGLGVGERVVVREVLEAGGHRRDGQPVRLEVVGLAGDLQAAERAVVGHGEPDRLGGLGDHAHVEAGVVGDEHVVAGELAQRGEVLGPAGGIRHHLRRDAVDAHVPLREVVVRERRPDVPVHAVDDAPVAHLHQPDRAGRGARGVGGLEVDRGEVHWHASIVARGRTRPGASRSASAIGRRTG